MIVLHMLLLAETVVHLSGTGKGGRNQELALAAAEGIAGLKDTAIFSIGSDGTDGPTDVAGRILRWGYERTPDGQRNRYLSGAAGQQCLHGAGGSGRTIRRGAGLCPI
jgi:hydroxypyruvate reductase